MIDVIKNDWRIVRLKNCAIQSKVRSVIVNPRMPCFGEVALDLPTLTTTRRSYEKQEDNVPFSKGPGILRKFLYVVIRSKLFGTSNPCTYFFIARLDEESLGECLSKLAFTAVRAILSRFPEVLIVSICPFRIHSRIVRMLIPSKFAASCGVTVSVVKIKRCLLCSIIPARL